MCKPSDAAGDGLGWKDLIRAWLAAVALSGVFLFVQGIISKQPIFLVADGFQYLSVAKNALAGNGLTTSILHFDEHFLGSEAPAPQTVSPPGYSLAIAALGCCGVPLEYAGFAISLLSYWALLFLVAIAGKCLGFSRLAVWFSVLLCAGNSLMWQFAVSVLSEPLFTTVTLSALLVLGCAESRPWSTTRYFSLLAIGSLLAAATYWIRYAGLFGLVGIGAFYFVRWCLQRDRRSFFSLLTFGGITAVSTLAGFARNHLLVGSWMGGNTMPVNRPMSRVLYEYLVSFFQMGVGRHLGPRHMMLPHVLSVLAAVAALVTCLVALALLISLFRSRRFAWIEHLKRPFPLLLLSYLAAYCAMLLYTGKQTMISLDGRMLIPTLPEWALIIGCLFPQPADADFAQWRPRRWKQWCGVFLASYFLVHLLGHGQYHVLFQPPMNELAVAREVFADVLPTGQTIRQWIDENVPADEVVFTLGGQEIGYDLGRPAVHVCGGPFSAQKWTENHVAELAEKYHIRYFIILPQTEASLALAADWPFLADLCNGRLPPWLSSVVNDPRCKILQKSPVL